MPVSELEEQLAIDIESFADDPHGFALYAYPWLEPGGELEKHSGPRDWQRDVFHVISDHLKDPETRHQPCRIAIASGHGIGKSAFISMLADWGISTSEDCRVVITANTGGQLDTKTWPEVCKWFYRSLNAHWWNVKGESISVRDPEHAETWRIDAVTWSENNTEAFAGLHNQGKRIIVIFDEASSIDRKVWEVTEGALTDEGTEIIWVVFGNPTQPSGSFRECFGRNKHLWHTMQIDSRTVEGTNKKLFQEWVDTYGEDSDFVKVRVRGEFPSVGSSQFIGPSVVEAARKRTVPATGMGVLSVDVARFGDDKTVFGYRCDDHYRVLEKLRGADTVQVARRVIHWIKTLGPRATVIDADGIGAGVIDYVRDEGYRQDVYEFHGAATPHDVDMYLNKRAEVWGRMREWLATGDIPDDVELADDLTGPEYFFARKGQIQLESKDDMKSRGLSSPDDGDTLAMTFAVNPRPFTKAELHTQQLAKALENEDRQEAYMKEISYRAQMAKAGSFSLSGGRRRR